MDLEVRSSLRGSSARAWRDLLAAAGLEAESLPEQTVLLWDGQQLAATGSREGNILKYLAVAAQYQGQGLLATVLTALRQEAFQAGCSRLFLYTKPENAGQFSALFFYPVAQTAQVLLMEDQKDGLRLFLESLPAAAVTGTIGAAVMNCDPFTLGHQHLIATAAAECDWVYVFAVSEDGGCFSPEDRLEMIRRGTAHLPNVTVLPTGPYLISQATFPTYFLKERDKAAQVHCMLDIAVFTGHFAPRFGITRRYVGEEPLSAMTESYNLALQAHLPDRGIEVRRIPRLEAAGKPISASYVRSLLTANAWQEAAALVPKTTFDYLQRICKEETI